MIDIHSHIIHGVDDGPSSIDESLRMLEKAENAGVKMIIATPHLHEPLFAASQIAENYQELQRRSKDFNVSIKMGYEVFIRPFTEELGKKLDDLVLGTSRYVLMELPFESIPIYSFDYIFKHQITGKQIIISHPERYRGFLKDINTCLTFLEKGCLMQLDAASITGVYGRRVKEFAKQMIKLRLVHFVASNAHTAEDYSKRYTKAYRKVVKWAGEEYSDKLFFRNAKAILDNAQDCIYAMI